jgi:hypothetical protein
MINQFNEKFIMIQNPERSKLTKFYIVMQLVPQILIVLATITFMLTADNFIDTIANFPIILYVNDIDNYFGSQLVKFLNINVFDDGEPDDLLVFEYLAEERVSAFWIADLVYIIMAVIMVAFRNFVILYKEFIKLNESGLSDEAREIEQQKIYTSLIIFAIPLGLEFATLMLAPWSLYCLKKLIVKFDRVPHPHHPDKKIKDA